MNVQELKKFASDASQVIGACQEFIGEQQAEIESLKAELNKKASETPAAATAEFDKDLLQKAASALHEVYGSPANVTPEQISAAWEAKPEFMLSAITKLASALSNRTAATGAELGQQIAKKASSEEVKASADEVFMRKYV